jgi:hypothetical protein
MSSEISEKIGICHILRRFHGFWGHRGHGVIPVNPLQEGLLFYVFQEIQKEASTVATSDTPYGIERPNVLAQSWDAGYNMEEQT